MIGISEVLLQTAIYAQNGNIADSNILYIKGGRIKLGNRKGDTDEKPAKKIKITSFYMGRIEVTNKEFAEFLNKKGNQTTGNTPWINLEGSWNNLKCRIYLKDSVFLVEEGFEDYPVNLVNWFGADAYCKWKGGRLPSEAEWEYALRSGFSKKEIKNIKMDDYAWYKTNSNYNLHKGGQLKPDRNGIFDMYGNLWEWCDDYYQAEYYKTRSRNNPKSPEKGDFRVMRGGSWTNDRETLSASNRNGLNPNSNKINVGFRIAFDVKK